jgi:hypothetical protein
MEERGETERQEQETGNEGIQKIRNKRQRRKKSRIIGKKQGDRKAGYKEDEAGIRKSGNKEEEGYLYLFFSLEISYASCAIVHVNLIPVIGKR